MTGLSNSRIRLHLVTRDLTAYFYEARLFLIAGVRSRCAACGKKRCGEYGRAPGIGITSNGRTFRSMVDSLTTIFQSLATAASTLQAFRNLIRGKKGDTRALLEEIKENAGLCWLVVERDTHPFRIIPELTTQEYDRLLRTSYNFNALKRSPIRMFPALRNRTLAAFAGKDTAHLLENIYDKTKTLQRMYRVDPDNPRIRWRVRIINLQKRILLLLKHLQD